MPETKKQRNSKGLYTKAELAAEKNAYEKRQEMLGKVARNNKIIKDAQAKQIPGTMYKGKGSDLPLTTSAPQPQRQAVKKVEGIKKGIAAPYTQSIGARQIDSPTNFRASQASNVESMNKNFTSANRIANRAAKTRGKGEAALASGNVAKAGRIRKKYDRQTERLNKKLK